MSDQLIGVIVGALIASLMPAITLWFEFRRWGREKQIEHYRGERDRLERLFEEARIKMVKGMTENSYPIDMIATFMHRCPDNVYKAFIEMMEQKDKKEEDYRHHHLNIASEMNKSISKIEKKIEEVIS
jgi:GTP-binding protein EngB required for normal cell division